jgi:predicted lipoprotein with Yx(FWY)xxD motif
VKNPLIYGCAAVATAALLAGCGSSSKSSSATTAAASTPASTATTQANTPAAATTTATPTAAVVVTSKPSKLGTILAVAPKKLSVYMFEADTSSQSACTGACEGAWPPVTSASAAQVSGGAVSGDLGTITRPNGSKQVTYKGHPLYFFAKDKDGGDAYGQGVKAFGADWYVLKPDGSKVDEGGSSKGGGGNAS